MAIVLSLLARVLTPTLAVLGSAAMWGLAHSLQATAWGLVIWWPFVIFSTLYLVWRERSTWAALGVAAATHALQNLAPGLLVAFG
jgi:membrane protease YdiL (CAAX protease family)